MYKMKYILACLILFNIIIKSQWEQDTIIYNPETKNYLIKYYDEDSGMLTVTFIPGNKINPLITSKVIKDSTNNSYLYNWKIKNDISSEQNLNYFRIKLNNSKIVNKTTNGWHNSKWTRWPIWSWRGDQGLEPGWPYIDGFALGSEGLPCIDTAYFKGISPIPRWSSIPDDKILDEYSKISGFPREYVVREAIVPGKIPASIIPLDFVDTIKAYCDSSYQLGWIQSEGLLNSLTKKLENAKKYLINGEIEEAIDLLNAFVNEVKAQNEKKLTSEAYALLKFNAEYLIEQIKKE